jgi:hypothetical protein
MYVKIHDVGWLVGYGGDDNVVVDSRCDDDMRANEGEMEKRQGKEWRKGSTKLRNKVRRKGKEA